MKCTHFSPLVVAVLLLLSASGWGQSGCELSNTGADGGIATISATLNQGYSAPGGVGAVGFRIPVSCNTGSVGYHVWRADTSPSSAPTTYDIGLYCVSGDCATGDHSGALYVHTGSIYGSWFTNNRVAATVTGVTAIGSQNTLTLSGSFNLPDFPLGDKVALSNCPGYNGTFRVTAATTSTVSVSGSVSQTSQVSNCTVVTSTTYPTSFDAAAVCTNHSFGVPCQEALPWITDNTTVCTALPCTLVPGIYAAAIGTSCSDALLPITCAQLLGDSDLGLIYPFTASTSYPGTLPATMVFTVDGTTAVWNTTQGPSAPIKPVKLLIY